MAIRTSYHEHIAASWLFRSHLFTRFARAKHPVDRVDRGDRGGKNLPVVMELDRLVLPRKATFVAPPRSWHPDPRAVWTASKAASCAIIDDTEETFGDPVKAHASCYARATPLLDGETPLNRLDTDFGSRQVEALLGRIAHGLAV